MDYENTHRFSANQQVSDITMLLWKLGIFCMDSMETLLYGTAWKHGYLFEEIDTEMYREQRTELLDLMMDVAQELGMTQEEIVASWNRAKQMREQGKEWGKQWREES